jgi:hypothetical protein
MNIGQFATACLTKGKSAKDTLAMVQRVFPESKTTMKCIYYYASKAKIKLAKSAVVDPKELKKAMAELAA